MTCPQCGYVLGPFERNCPKCARLARTQAVSASAPPAAQAHKMCPMCRQPAVLQMAACGRCGYRYTMQEGRGRSSLFLPILLLGLLFLLVPLLSLFLHAARQRATAGSGLALLPSGSGQAGANLVGAPAVGAQQIAQRLTESAATTGGEVEVSLAWNSLTDLDLEVRDPAGELITANHRRSNSGGVQDVDANPTLVTPEGSLRAAMGQNPGPENVLPLPDILVDLDKQIGLPEGFSELAALAHADGKAPSRYTRTPVEHIYFARAPRGTYTVYARCYSWREPNRSPLPFTIQVRSRGQVFYEASGTLGPESYITHSLLPTPICQFAVR